MTDIEQVEKRYGITPLGRAALAYFEEHPNAKASAAFSAGWFAAKHDEHVRTETPAEGCCL